MNKGCSICAGRVRPTTVSGMPLDTCPYCGRVFKKGPVQQKLDLTTREEWHPAIARQCAGCQKPAPSARPGELPKGWVIVFTPLYGQPWTATACSMRCAGEARVQAVLKLHRLMRGEALEADAEHLRRMH